MKLITSLMLILGLNVAPLLAQVDSFTFHITVVDEETSEPIEGATAGVSFSPGGELGGASRSKKATTNKEGKVTIEGKSIFSMRVAAKKDGWYWSGIEAPNRVPDEKGKYHPKSEQEITLRLRKIKNPIELFAKKVTLSFPQKNEWMGFDFKVGDWVEPNGKGKVTDIFFKVETEHVDWRTASGSLQIKFPNEGDGILLEEKYIEMSELKLPYKAPEKGYRSEWIRTEEGVYNKQMKSNAGYFIRSRSQKSGEKITKANYTKLASDIEFDPRETGWHVSHKNKPKTYARITFTYYFNPTANDQNLEFDPEKNLFQDEQISAP